MSFSSKQYTGFHFNIDADEIIDIIQNNSLVICEECELQFNIDELYVCSSCNRQLCNDCFLSDFEALCYDCSNLSDAV